MTINLTPASFELFLAYAKDANNWSGCPWVSEGNIQPTKEQRGNLSDLVQKELIVIHDEDEDSYLTFTDKGLALAEANGVIIWGI